MALAKQVEKINDADAVEYTNCLNDVFGDNGSCPDVFKTIKTTKHIDYLLGLHKFDELIKMFCTDSEEKLTQSRVAFEVERVFAALLSMQVKKKKKGQNCTGLILSLENAPATFLQPELKKACLLGRSVVQS